MMAVVEQVDSSARPLLEASNLKKVFQLRGGREALAVDGVSLKIAQGTTLGIVGESGCGKSTLGRLLVGLTQPDDGWIMFEEKELPPERPREVLRNIQMVFQDPYSALNPKASIGESIGLPLRIHGHSRKSTSTRVDELLGQVGLHANHASYYPHQLSGGQRQRVNIARALALEPKLVVCDEAVSALDKSIQAQILSLLRELQRERKLSFVFISHDLNVVEYMSSQVAVMYLGQLVEVAPANRLYREPLHPYTRALLASIPQVDTPVAEEQMLEGEVPSPLDPPSGCRFRTRCPHVMAKCASDPPPAQEMAPGHWVSCHLYGPKISAPEGQPTQGGHVRA